MTPMMRLKSCLISRCLARSYTCLAPLCDIKAKGLVKEPFSEAPISIWWDMNSCKLPKRSNLLDIFENIKLALSRKNYWGNISSIFAYGDTRHISKKFQRNLKEMDVNFTHVPALQDELQKDPTSDMIRYFSLCPPMNILVISGDTIDGRLCECLKIQRNEGLNILLATTNEALDSYLVEAANCVWLWTDLAFGGHPQFLERDNILLSIDSKLRSVLSNSIMANGTSKDLVEEAHLKVKTYVFWDIDSCPLPSNEFDPACVYANISLAISKVKYGIPIYIFAYGDTSRMPDNVQRALSATGIDLVHVSPEGSFTSREKMLVDMLCLAVDVRALKHVDFVSYLVISEDEDGLLGCKLRGLWYQRFHILAAQPNAVETALSRSATCVWLWTDLVSGGLPRDRSSW